MKKGREEGKVTQKCGNDCALARLGKRKITHTIRTLKKNAKVA